MQGRALGAREWHRGAQEQRPSAWFHREQIGHLHRRGAPELESLGVPKHCFLQVGLQVDVERVVQDATVASDTADRACTTTLDGMALFHTTWLYKA